MEYIVKWKIELSADTPENAVRLALDCLQDPESICHVFDVYDSDLDHTIVDLDNTME